MEAATAERTSSDEAKPGLGAMRELGVGGVLRLGGLELPGELEESW